MASFPNSEDLNNRSDAYYFDGISCQSVLQEWKPTKLKDSEESSGLGTQDARELPTGTGYGFSSYEVLNGEFMPILQRSGGTPSRSIACYLANVVLCNADGRNNVFEKVHYDFNSEPLWSGHHVDIPSRISELGANPLGEVTEVNPHSMFDRVPEHAGQGSSMMNCLLNTPPPHWYSGRVDGDAFQSDDHEATSVCSKGQSEGCFDGHEVQSQLLVQEDFRNARVTLRCPTAFETFLNRDSDLYELTHPAPHQSCISGNSYCNELKADALPVLAPRYGADIGFEVPGQTPANRFSGLGGQQEIIRQPAKMIPNIGQLEGFSGNEVPDIISIDPSNLAPHHEDQVPKEQFPLTIRSPTPESPLSSPASPEVFCPTCLQPFTGNKRYASQNLARHMKSVCSRNMVVCAFENCKKSFTRKDNLLKHQQDKGHC